MPGRDPMVPPSVANQGAGHASDSRNSIRNIPAPKPHRPESAIGMAESVVGIAGMGTR